MGAKAGGSHCSVSIFPLWKFAAVVMAAVTMKLMYAIQEAITAGNGKAFPMILVGLPVEVREQSACSTGKLITEEWKSDGRRSGKVHRFLCGNEPTCATVAV